MSSNLLSRYRKFGQSLTEFAIWGTLVLIVGGSMISYALYYIHQQDIMYKNFRRAVALAKNPTVSGGGRMVYSIMIWDKRFPGFSTNVPMTNLQHFSIQSSAIWSADMLWDSGYPEVTYAIIEINGRNIAKDIVSRPYFMVDTDTLEDKVIRILDAISAMAMALYEKDNPTSEESDAITLLLGLHSDLSRMIDSYTGPIDASFMDNIADSINTVFSTPLGTGLTVEAIINRDSELSESLSDIRDEIANIKEDISNGNIGTIGDYSFVKSEGLDENVEYGEEGQKLFKADSSGNMKYKDSDQYVKRTFRTHSGEYEIDSRIPGQEIDWGDD